MVMVLPHPTIDSLSLVDDVVAERQDGKNAGFFSGIREEWRNRVQAYIDSAGSPATVPRWLDIEHKRGSFLNLYVSPSKGSVQASMLTDMRKHNLSLCPACGEAGAPNTLDHYLPKGKYPHFCVTPYNLFPMCDACQTAKKEKTGDVANPRFFLHPYFDVFLAEQVLELSIIEPYSAPTFDLAPAASLGAGERALVSAHVRELDIVARYARFFRNEYQRLLRLAQSLRTAELDVTAYLIVFRDAAAAPSRNAWDHVLYTGVLNDAALLDYVSNGEFPPYR